MKWIGLTGGIACGKSSVSTLLKMHAIPIVDADEIAREVVKPDSTGLKAIVNEFGPGFLSDDGYMDRQMMAQHVFGNPKELRRLETILHPLIRAETKKRRKQLEDAGTPVAVYDIPLLFETKSEDQFDAIVVVSCTPQQQKERLQKRHEWSDYEIDQRIAAQMPIKLKEKGAHFIVKNNLDEVNLKNEVDRLLKWLKEKHQA